MGADNTGSTRNLTGDVPRDIILEAPFSGEDTAGPCSGEGVGSIFDAAVDCIERRVAQES